MRQQILTVFLLKCYFYVTSYYLLTTTLSTSIYTLECGNYLMSLQGDKQLINHYWPIISLLPICGKILEQIIFNDLYINLHTNNLITKHQSGFHLGDSTQPTNYYIFLMKSIRLFIAQPSSSLEQYLPTFSKIWDFQIGAKWPVPVLQVYYNTNIQNSISNNLIKLLINNRKQRVVINGSYPNYFCIVSGVPQGSVHSSLLFLVYINDLERNID